MTDTRDKFHERESQVAPPVVGDNNQSSAGASSIGDQRAENAEPKVTIVFDCDVRAFARRHRQSGGPVMTRFAPHHSFNAPLYLVMRDYGRHGFEGVAYPETSKRNIIEDIQSGQIDRVVAVLEIFEGRSRDITDDIREAVEAQREAA
jgi:hypothetical protein